MDKRVVAVVVFWLSRFNQISDNGGAIKLSEILKNRWHWIAFDHRPTVKSGISRLAITTLLTPMAVKFDTKEHTITSLLHAKFMTNLYPLETTQSLKSEPRIKL